MAQAKCSPLARARPPPRAPQQRLALIHLQHRCSRQASGGGGGQWVLESLLPLNCPVDSAGHPARPVLSCGHPEVGSRRCTGARRARPRCPPTLWLRLGKGQEGTATGLWSRAGSEPVPLTLHSQPGASENETPHSSQGCGGRGLVQGTAAGGTELVALETHRLHESQRPALDRALGRDVVSRTHESQKPGRREEKLCPLLSC